MPICKLCGRVFPNRIEINGIVRTINKRKYCLECSPFGQHNTRTLHITFNGKFCLFCKSRLSGKQVKYCSRSCKSSHYSTISRTELKKKAVEYKGGRCERCGYNKCIRALEFHHVDPTLKDPTVMRYHSTKWEKVKVEIDKCILLCANCHREEHYNSITSHSPTSLLAR